MNFDEMLQSWEECINDLFKITAMLSYGLPPLYAYPHCATCAYWELFGEDELNAMSREMYDLHYEAICRGIRGQIIKRVVEDGVTVDHYEDYKFFGFCKRYPPTPNSSDQFTAKSKPLFLKADRYIFEYKYSITDHQQWCGEWKRGNSFWCKKTFLIKMAATYLKGEYPQIEGLPEKWALLFKD